MVDANYEHAKPDNRFIVDKIQKSDGTQPSLLSELATILANATDVAFVNSITTGASAGGTQVIDTTMSFEVNMWDQSHHKGMVDITIGGVHYWADILSNTVDTLTFAAIGIAIPAGAEYSIKALYSAVDISSWGGTPLTGADLTLAIQALLQKGLTPSTYNVTVIADNEGSVVLPDHTKQLTIKMIGGTSGDSYRTAWVTGKVATPVAPYDYHDGAACGSLEGVDLVGKTLYFATSKIGGATFAIEAIV
jgi:hypothetical protein